MGAALLAGQETLRISAFKDISAFILDTGQTEKLIDADVKYVKDANEAHSDLIEHQADIVFMSYDDTLSMAVQDNYQDIVAIMPIHGGLLYFCGEIDFASQKTIIGIDTDSGYARTLRYYLHQRYPSPSDYKQLQWVQSGATNVRYSKLLNTEINRHYRKQV